MKAESEKKCQLRFCERDESFPQYA